MSKKKKVEKETRRVIEAMTELVKRKGDRYKFKTKNKKAIKKVKKRCVHWIIRKGKEVPTVYQDPSNPVDWLCPICDASFPIKPAEVGEYMEAYALVRSYVEQMLFWSIKLGGNKEDTAMFMNLKRDLPRLEKVTRQILKQVDKRNEWENNRKNAGSRDKLNMFASFNYNP